MPQRLYINGRYIGGGTTAVNAVARDLTHALCAASSAQWDVSVAVPPDLKDAALEQGLPVTVVGRRSGILWEQLDLPSLRHSGVIAGFFNTVPLSGRGYVTMVHDAHVFSTPASYGRATRLWRQRLSRQAGRAGNAIVTVSEHSRAALLAYGIGLPERIGVVPNGLGPVGKLEPDSAIFEKIGVQRDAPYCVALSSTLPHKNIGLLLRAFAQPELSGVKLVLIGKADAADLQAAGHDVPPAAVLGGFVSDAELAALYTNALAVCMPSTEEGFGLPALEGMALGAAALVSDRGALPEVVGTAGVILPADDATAWSTAILRLIDRPAERAALVIAGRARARAFTWEAAAQKFLGHLDNWYGPAEH